MSVQYAARYIKTHLQVRAARINCKIGNDHVIGKNTPQETSAQMAHKYITSKPI